MLCDILDRFALGLGIVALTLIINRSSSMKTVKEILPYKDLNKIKFPDILADAFEFRTSWVKTEKWLISRAESSTNY
jgi:hypothetical protein